MLGNRVMLHLLAQIVSDGQDPQMSMYYEAALAAFGPESPHFTAACRGQVGAGMHYQNTVAGGRFRDGV